MVAFAPCAWAGLWFAKAIKALFVCAANYAAAATVSDVLPKVCLTTITEPLVAISVVRVAGYECAMANRAVITGGAYRRSIAKRVITAITATRAMFIRAEFNFATV